MKLKLLIISALISTAFVSYAMDETTINMSDADTLNSTKREKELELFAAIRAGATEKVKALLASGVDVNCKDENGLTPLYATIQEDDKDKIKQRITELELFIAMYSGDAETGSKKMQAVRDSGVANCSTSLLEDAILARGGILE